MLDGASQISHMDVIHDIAFDFYGKRFATCSSDKHIKIWTIDNSTQSREKQTAHVWQNIDISRAHQDSIWRLSWANPEFGEIIASCSEDGTVCIWEEQELSKWTKKVTLSSSKYVPVRDVKFAPRNMGLQIATASADGYLRIYEAGDMFELSSMWNTVVEFQVEDIMKVDSSGYRSEHGLNCLAWNDSPFEPAKIAVGGYSRRAVVLAMDKNHLKEECVLGEHHNPIHDIAWAPSMGRSYHLIATASREPTFQIHKLKKREDGSLEYVSPAQYLQCPNQSDVCRVAWNATGTVLATSSEDETICLWRRNFAGDWINFQTIPRDMETKLTYFHQNV
mmetsp:Transcript_24116/g.33064  ORF Transcript_24116/g.33064 Transcript_24116/m.33064 type:complete len:335 (-) Transcript_24116:88-1092(-)